MWPFSKRLPAVIGRHPLEEACLLADVTPRDETWLDERTVDDLELGAVFSAIDRTRTATGAQVLWRWLRAPTLSPDVLARREAAIAAIDPVRVADAIGVPPDKDGSLLPALLWKQPPRPFRGRVIAALLSALVAALLGTLWWPPLLFVAIFVFIANLFLDDWSKIRLSHAHAAIKVLDGVLGRAIALAAAFPTLAAPVREDLRLRGMFRRRIALLRLSDPFGFADMVRAGFLVRVLITRSCMKIIDAERERLRRVVEWFGEMDALTSIKLLRSERDLHIPEIVAGAPSLEAHDLMHPAVPDCVGNDVTLRASGLLVTGSNMSGKSTFLRTIAINAILAQSIHTTFGTWRASPLHVRAVMRIEDVLESGMSTYAVEVAAMHELISDARPCLFVIDEPFHGTNPAVRVPIIVAVLEYLVGRGLVVTATHDLDVAHQLDDRFARGYFEERDGDFDRTLRTGIAPASNAIEILRRAGYPDAIMARLG